MNSIDNMLANGLNLSHSMAAEKLEERSKMDFYGNKLSLPSPTGSKPFHPPNFWTESSNSIKRSNNKSGTLLQSPPAGPLGSLDSLRNYFQINMSPDYNGNTFSRKNSIENSPGALNDMDLAAVNYRNFYLYHHYLMSIQLHQQQQAQQAHHQQQSQQSLASELSRLRGFMGEKYYEGKNFITPKCQTRPMKNNTARHPRKSHPYLPPPTYSRQNCNTTYKTAENLLIGQNSVDKEQVINFPASNNLYPQRQSTGSNKSPEYSDNNINFRHNDGQVTTTMTCPICKTHMLPQNVSEHFKSEIENFKTFYCNGNVKKSDILPLSNRSADSQKSPKSTTRTSKLFPINTYESSVEILPVIYQIKQTYIKVRNNRKQRLQRNYLMIKSYESTFNSPINEKKDYTISNILNQSHGSSSPPISTIKIEEDNTFFQEENSSSSFNDKLDGSKTQVENDPEPTRSPSNQQLLSVATK